MQDKKLRLVKEALEEPGNKGCAFVMLDSIALTKKIIKNPKEFIKTI
jgi:hypothetical protein